MSLAPYQFLGRDGRVFVCAWCQKDQGVAVEQLPPDSSHGICPVHRAQFLAGIGGSKPQVPISSGSPSGLPNAEPVPAA